MEDKRRQTYTFVSELGSSSHGRRESTVELSQTLVWLASKVERYTADAWWMGRFELVLRLCQTSLMALVTNRSVQAALASCLAVVGVVVNREVAPYRRGSDNTVAELTQALLWLWCMALLMDLAGVFSGFPITVVGIALVLATALVFAYSLRLALIDVKNEMHIHDNLTAHAEAELAKALNDVKEQLNRHSLRASQVGSQLVDALGATLEDPFTRRTSNFGSGASSMVGEFARQHSRRASAFATALQGAIGTPSSQLPSPQPDATQHPDPKSVLQEDEKQPEPVCDQTQSTSPGNSAQPYDVTVKKTWQEILLDNMCTSEIEPSERPHTSADTAALQAQIEELTQLALSLGADEKGIREVTQRHDDIELEVRVEPVEHIIGEP